jgi:hypothetical protein
MPKIMLRDICHARSGDKGDTVNLGLICYNPADYDWLKRHVTPEAVLKHFALLAKGPAHRYELPNLAALNFLIEHALDGGVTKALMIDGHGKGYSAILLEMIVETDEMPAGRAGLPQPSFMETAE